MDRSRAIRHSDAMTKITRRSATGLLISGTLMPGAAMAQQKKKKKNRRQSLKERPPPSYPKLAALLENRLNAGLAPGCNGAFKVPAFDYGKAKGQSHMRVVVRLDWPPGWRQRPLQSSGPDDQTAFDNLVNDCIALFDDVWPGCVS